MNSPYPELLTDRTQQLAAFLEWNAGIALARTEYTLHPFSDCQHNGNCRKDRGYGRS
jgi:hypothetical protein